LFATDQRAAGERLLREVAAERSYYGFLAADLAGLPYRFDPATTEADDETIERLANDPAAIRARELYLTGLHSRGRRQWAAFSAGLGENEKRAAAVLAHRWGWHSRAIAIVGELAQYDDLDLRYPLPFSDWFTASAGKAAIPAAWAYGVARSESLFMPDVRSSAGAIGVMQLMPATGKRTAGKHGLPYAGTPTLTDPEQNIAIGTRYLAELDARFGSHRALATAAYNAGPHRVERWLPATTPMRAATWIETLPYDETRSYVQRVLAAEAIFHWRLTGEIRRLSAVLTPVPAKDRTGPVVSSL
jgi:soluble lytic murein transglycosylase